MILLKQLLHVTAATCLLIIGSRLLSLGVFPGDKIFDLAPTLSVVALFGLTPIYATMSWLFRLKSSGFLLDTLAGTISGSVALCLVGLLLPGRILLPGLLAAAPFALVNTLLIWLLTFATGLVDPRSLRLFPERKD